jgi:uroporphyrinogen decarboxylase
MNGRERFKAIMNYGTFDHVPAWFFGQWDETYERWKQEGMNPGLPIDVQTGMDKDWNTGMWKSHGLVNTDPIPLEPPAVLEETADYRIRRTNVGAVVKEGKHGSSLAQHLKAAMEPTKADWDRFKKHYDATDPSRYPQGWEEKAVQLEKRQDAFSTLGGSLYATGRDWLGVEEWSCLPFTDPALYEEMIDYTCDFFIQVNTPMMKKVRFEIAYLFEDCCFNTGPLISPEFYDRFYKKYYRKMTDFFHANGVDKVLMDSDGKIDQLIPNWLDSGIDILFPVEVGVWGQDPVQLRRQFGKNLRMMGGFDKHLIPKGEQAIRESLLRLKPLVEEGGYIPLPDHLIPPHCSWEQFRTYVKVFKQVFGA